MPRPGFSSPSLYTRYMTVQEQLIERKVRPIIPRGDRS
jgi:hypothetical protein